MKSEQPKVCVGWKRCSVVFVDNLHSYFSQYFTSAVLGPEVGVGLIVEQSVKLKLSFKFQADLHSET